jgi:hypothetical protein
MAQMNAPQGYGTRECPSRLWHNRMLLRAVAQQNAPQGNGNMALMCACRSDCRCRSTVRPFGEMRLPRAPAEERSGLAPAKQPMRIRWEAGPWCAGFCCPRETDHDAHQLVGIPAKGTTISGQTIAREFYPRILRGLQVRLRGRALSIFATYESWSFLEQRA